MAPNDKVDFTETPEFATAVARAAEAAVAKALEGARSHGMLPDTTGGAQAMLSQLALTLAEVNNQGQPNKVVVAPDVMRARAAAHQRMVALLVDAHHKAEEARQDGDREGMKRWRPRYRLLKECYLGDRVVNPYRVGRNKEAIPQEITWSRVPNLVMSPLNDIAKQVYAEFRASIGNTEKVIDVSPLMSITTGGLIIHGKALDTQRRTVRMEDDEEDYLVDADVNSYENDRSEGIGPQGLDVMNDDPRNKTRRVLGTIQAGATMSATTDTPPARF